jgi:Protein of unknown function (DUF3810)
LNANRITWGQWLDIVVIVAAVVLQIVPIPQDWIENAYANGFYAAMARTFVPLSNNVSFAIGDVLSISIIVALIVYWIGRFRNSRGRRWAAFAAALFGTLGFAATLALWFDVSWALNYRRAPIIARVVFDPARVNAQSVAAFSKRIVDDLNATAPRAHELNEPSDRMQVALVRAYEPVVNRLGDVWTVNVSRPKTTLLQPWFAAAGIGGQWDPFAYETIVNADFLPFELPFALSHEWGHVAGFGDESDANLIAALTCMRSTDPLVHYSGLIWTYGFLPDSEKQRLKVSPLVYADLVASRDRFLRHYNPKIYSFQWFAYDKFLRANRVSRGVVSYSLFVQMLVGMQIDRDGLPVVRAPTLTRT